MEGNKHSARSINSKNCLFVSLIPAETTQEDLYSYFFSKFGEVEILALQRKPEGVTPQIAIIRPKSKVILKHILTEERHELFPGNVLKVEKYLLGEDLEEMEEDIFKRRVSIFGLYGKISDEELKEKLSIFGEVEVCYLKYYPDNPHKAHGFITFANEKGAENALKAKKLKILGRFAKIKTFEGRTEKNRKILISKNQIGRGIPHREDIDLQNFEKLNFKFKQRIQKLNYSKNKDERDNQRQKFEFPMGHSTFNYINTNKRRLKRFGDRADFPLPKVERLFKGNYQDENLDNFLFTNNKKEEIPLDFNFVQNHDEMANIPTVKCQNFIFNHFYSQKDQISFFREDKCFYQNLPIFDFLRNPRPEYEYFEEVRDRIIFSQMKRKSFRLSNQEFKNTLSAILYISGHLGEVNHGWRNLRENQFF